MTREQLEHLIRAASIWPVGRIESAFDSSKDRPDPNK
jgi:hypothetical protein